MLSILSHVIVFSLHKWIFRLVLGLNYPILIYSVTKIDQSDIKMHSECDKNTFWKGKKMLLAAISHPEISSGSLIFRDNDNFFFFRADIAVLFICYINHIIHFAISLSHSKLNFQQEALFFCYRSWMESRGKRLKETEKKRIKNGPWKLKNKSRRNRRNHLWKPDGCL